MNLNRYYFALQGGVSNPRNESIMKLFSLLDEGERVGLGISNMMVSWEKYARLEPQYEVKLNPARMISVLPYTIQAIQETGKLLASERGVLKKNDDPKSGPKSGPKKLTVRQRLILEVLAADASLSAKAISEKTSERISEKVSVSDWTIETNLVQLKKLGILSREGGRKEGKWIIKTDE